MSENHEPTPQRQSRTTPNLKENLRLPWTSPGHGPGLLYRRVWWIFTAPLWLLGVVAGLLLGQPGAWVAVAIIMGSVAGLVGVLWASERGVGSGEVARFGFRLGLVAVAVCLAVVGAFAVLDWLAVVLVVVIVGTSPYALSALTGWEARGRGERMNHASPGAGRPAWREQVWGLQGVDLADRGDGVACGVGEGQGVLGALSGASGQLQSPTALRNLSTEQLVRSWRVSFCVLSEASSPEVLAWLADYRYRCLAEFERRDPAGLQRWLDSGARAAGNPGPFLNG